MAKKLQLDIPEPCHESWDEMTQTDRGRYCASCNKEVTDFTNMNDDQLVDYFKRNSGQACGKLHIDQLNRTLEPSKRPAFWVKYFFQITLPAFIISMRSSAQENVKLHRKHTISTSPAVFIPIRDLYLKQDTMNNHSPALLPKINSPAAELSPVVGASQPLPAAINWSEVACIRVGGITAYPVENVRNLRKDKKDTLLNKIVRLSSNIRDTVVKLFKIFPNPVVAGTSLHIEWTRAEEGYFVFDLFDVGGKKIYSREIWMDKNARLVNLEIPLVKKGNYFLRAVFKESGEGSTEKVTIQ